ncbi:MAG: alpha/beta fold hydrolase [bacterium]
MAILKLKKRKSEEQEEINHAINPIFFDSQSEIGVLLLHSFTGCPTIFHPLADFLRAQGFTVYAPLVAGHGTSYKDLEKVTKEDWQNSVEEAYIFLRSKVKHVFIVGDSFGGNLAYDLAHRHQDICGVISMSSPITLRWHWLIKFRTMLYGWSKSYYKKPKRHHHPHHESYDIIPIKSLREFLSFIEERTMKHLNEVKVPALIIHAPFDPVIHPCSANYIFEHLGSVKKELLWFESSLHGLLDDTKHDELLQIVSNFIHDTAKDCSMHQ